MADDVLGTYGVWVSRGRIPMMDLWRPDSAVQVRRVPMPGPWKDDEEGDEDEDEGCRLTGHPPPPVVTPPAQPPVEEMDEILLEYAQAAGISTKGYRTDRAYWRRQIGWTIKQHADRLRYG